MRKIPFISYFLFFIAVCITNITNADISVLYLKGIDAVLSNKYQHLSPVLGFLSDEAGLAETIYRLAPINSDKNKVASDKAVYDLVKELFYLNNDGINFGYNQNDSNLGLHLSPRIVGEMVGRIEQKNIWDPKKPPQELAKFNNPKIGQTFRSVLRSCIEYEKDKKNLGWNITQIILLNFLKKKWDEKRAFVEYFEGLTSILGKDCLAEVSDYSDEATLSGKNFLRKEIENWTNSNDFFTDKDYEKSINDIQEALNKSEIQKLPPSTIALGLNGGKFLRILPYRNDTRYEGQVFSDCGETTLRNFFNMLFYDEETNDFDTNRLENKGFKLHQDLKQFYLTYKTQDSHTLKQAYDDWAKIFSNLKNPVVIYNKRNHTCELSSEKTNPNRLVALQNLCAAIRNVINFPEKYANLKEDSLQKNSIKVLYESLFGDNKYNVTDINGKSIRLELDVYVLSFTPGHFEFYNNNNAKNSMLNLPKNFMKLFNRKETFAHSSLLMSLIRNNYENLTLYQENFSFDKILFISPLFVLKKELSPQATQSHFLQNYLHILKERFGNHVIRSISSIIVKFNLLNNLDGMAKNNLLATVDIKPELLTEILVSQYQTREGKIDFNQSEAIYERLSSIFGIYTNFKKSYKFELWEKFIPDPQSSIFQHPAYIKILLTIPIEEETILDYIDYLLKTNPDIVTNKYDGDYTLLHYAAENGHAKIALMLLDKGSNINAQDRARNTPLHKAALHGHTKIVEILLNNKAKIEAENLTGDRALHEAVSGNNIETTEYLIKHKASINALNAMRQSPLHIAVCNGSNAIPIIKLLLTQKNLKIDSKNILESTPLHDAVRINNYDIVQYLISKGANLDTQNNQGNTLLHTAIKNKNIGIAKLLINAGAKVSLKNKNQRTALQEALRDNDQIGVNFLKQYETIKDSTKQDSDSEEFELFD